MSYKNQQDKIDYDRNYYASHKETAKKNMHSWYEKNRESAIASAKDYYEKNKKRNFQLSAEYRRQHPEQARAHSAIGNALRRGKLIKPDTCEDCRRKARIESHHHNGYAKEHRLDVRWLCHRCHMKAHTCRQ